LYYYGARYYAPWSCRFVSIDPLAGEMPFATPFSYAANNPIGLVDVDGLAPGGGNDSTSGDKKGNSNSASSNITALQARGWYTTGIEPDMNDAQYSVLDTDKIIGVDLEAISNHCGELIAVRPLAEKTGEKNPYKDGANDFLGSVWDFVKGANPFVGIYMTYDALSTGFQEGDWSKTGNLALRGMGGSVPVGIYHGGEFFYTMATGSDYDRKRMLTTEALNFVLNAALAGAGGKKGGAVEGGGAAEGKPDGVKMYDTPAGPKQKTGPLHHIFTNKFWKSLLRGGPWSPRFEKIFKKAGLELDGEYNEVKVPGHKGPHPKAYHTYIYERLTSAIEGLTPYTSEYRNAVLDVLAKLRLEAETPGTQMNKWLLKI
jgi:A nuclease family of the HNH/ENDO VII superfamily with conserved AHH